MTFQYTYAHLRLHMQTSKQLVRSPSDEHLRGNQSIPLFGAYHRSPTHSFLLFLLFPVGFYLYSIYQLSTECATSFTSNTSDTHHTSQPSGGRQKTGIAFMDKYSNQSNQTDNHLTSVANVCEQFLTKYLLQYKFHSEII